MTFLMGSSPQAAGTTGRDLPPTTRDYMGAVLEDTLKSNPVNYVADYLLEPKNNILVDKETARQQMMAEGVNINIPDEGIDDALFNHRLTRAKQDRYINDVYSRTSGVGNLALGLTAGLAAELVNPINYIPIIGPSRYASIIASRSTAAGRFGARAGLSAVEASLATTLSEPATYYFRNKLGDDYSVYDSTANIFFGAAFGAALGGVGGVVADKFKLRSGMMDYVSPADKENLLPLAANEFLTTGDIKSIRMFEAAIEKQYGVPFKDLTPERLRKLFDEGPNSLYREQGEAKFNEQNPQLATRRDELVKYFKDLDNAKELNEFALKVSDPTQAARVSEIQTKFGKEVTDDFSVYKSLVERKQVTTDKRNLKSIEKDIAKYETKYGDLFQRAIDKPLLDRLDTKSMRDELEVLSSQRKMSVNELTNDLREQKFKEYSKLYDEYAATPLSTIGKDRLTVLENQRIDEDLVATEKYAKEDTNVIQEEIDALIESEASFVKRTGAEASVYEELDFETFRVGVKNFVNCLLR